VRAAANSAAGWGVHGGWDWRLTGEGVLGGAGRGASPDASSKLIIRVIYTDEFRFQTQFLLMQACPLFRAGVCTRMGVCGCWRMSGGTCVTTPEPGSSHARS
jgi:hypothetical protein